MNNDLNNPELIEDESLENLPVAGDIEVEATREAIEEKTFADYGVRQDIVDSLAADGILHPFPIQAMTLPVALGGNDIIGQAKTGTGKTLGFGIPALQLVVGPDDEGYDKLPDPGAPQALIVVPTRELAVQVGADLNTASKFRNARVAVIYGGRSYDSQIEELKRGVEIVVGTPGRLMDLQRQKYLSLKNVNIVILDEADEMLDLGFLPDVEKILASTTAIRQTMLFSATMPGPVIAMARRYMTRPMHIRASDPFDESITKKSIRQLVYRVHQLDKEEMVARILQAEGRGRTIIFTKTKRSAAKVTEELIDRGFAAGAIHGDLGQGAREQALRAFRNGKVDVLVATDVAARGIDVDDVTHVINFQCPEDEKTYLHRVGRTGRAGNLGTAVTFVDWEDIPRWGLINKALGLDYANPAETYSSSAHFFEELNIPAGTKGRLPRHKRVREGLEAEELETLDAKKDRPASRDGGRGAGSRTSGGRSGGSRSGGSRSGGTRGGSSRSGERGGNRGENSTENSSATSADETVDEGTRARRRRRTVKNTDGTAATTASREDGEGKHGHSHGRADRPQDEHKAPRRRRTRRVVGEGEGSQHSENQGSNE
ncbi:superfamily II DNA/RNA helicase [Neomicrococcus lactis]|uniref:RNA helicase n=1 Tax=Neomicrococcus lactis TaxID=732241 RepID=A0A7W8Y928_9MICC|nr:superfamily II DNA/RNA helicase [Neomicrococcus lactis]